MFVMRYDKLVRDLIPSIIESEGRTCAIHVAEESEYFKALNNKLREETEEFLRDGLFWKLHLTKTAYKCRVKISPMGEEDIALRRRRGDRSSAAGGNALLDVTVVRSA